MTRPRWSLAPAALAALTTIVALLAAPAPPGAASAGARWLAPQVVAPGPAIPPVAATTPAGDGVLAWQTVGADAGVWVTVRPAGTVAWPAPVRVSGLCPGGGCTYPQLSLATGGDGTVALTWLGGAGSGRTPVVVTRPPGAASFGAPVAVGDAGDVTHLAMGVDGAGQVTLAWKAVTGPVWSARTTGGAWGAPQEVSAGTRPGGGVRVAVGAGGDAVATWTEAPCEPTAARRRGGVWEAPVALDPGRGVCPGVIEARITPAGEALAVWDGRRGPDPVVLSSWSGPSATAWRTPQAVGTSDGSSLIISRRLAVGGPGSRLVWQDDQETTLTSFRPDGGVWAAPVEIPGLGGYPGPVGAAGGDGTVIVGAGSSLTRPVLGAAAAPGATWTAPVPLAPAARGPWTSEVAVAADAAGDGFVAWLSEGGIMSSDLAARPGPGPVLPAASIRAVRPPAHAPVRSLVTIETDATLPAGTTRVQVQRRLRGAWRPYGTVSLVPSMDLTGTEVTATGRLRLTTLGTLRLRLVAPGAAPSRAVTVRAVRPPRARVPVGPAPSQIAVGAGGVWVLGQDASGATVRRLDPATGRVRRVIQVGGTATGLAAGAGAVWVMRGSELLRVDPASGEVTASGRVCGRGTPIAGREGVWVGGACVPGETVSTGLAVASPGVVYRIDPATARPVGAPLRVPGLSLGGGALAGGVLWIDAFSEDADLRSGGGAVPFDPATGAQRGPGTGLVSRGAIVPVGAARVWAGDATRLRQLLPRTREITRVARGMWALTPAGGRVVALVSVRGKAGMPHALTTYAAASGVRGRTVIIGASPLEPATAPRASVAVGRGAAWVLLPTEGAVVRVPLRGPQGLMR